jgi:hypothetical protein
MARFREQMAAKDASTHAFCNYILDQEDYQAPGGGPVVTLPDTYRHVWGDGNGNYFLSDDPTVDLRGVGGGNWQPMSKAGD